MKPEMLALLAELRQAVQRMGVLATIDDQDVIARDAVLCLIDQRETEIVWPDLNNSEQLEERE